MNTNERIKMLKAMEFIARNVNNESFLNGWLALGVADGDIEYGDLSVGPDDADELGYYMEDGPFADLMDTFLRCMAHARRDGGLYCDGVVSKNGKLQWVIKGIGDTVVLGRDRQKKKSRTFTQEAQADAYLKRNGFTISLY